MHIDDFNEMSSTSRSRTPTEVQASMIADLEARLVLADERHFFLMAENARLRAEVERLKPYVSKAILTVEGTMLCSPQVAVKYNDAIARAEHFEAEVERLEAEALRWSLLAKSNAQAHNRTEDERFNLFLEVKKLRAEQQAQQEINKPAK